MITSCTQNYFNPHLPRGRWPYAINDSTSNGTNFNPHLPRGRWLCLLDHHCNCLLFQSTPSSRKVTFSTLSKRCSIFISIHTFLAEGDVNVCLILDVVTKFQSTPSSRKVTVFCCNRFLSFIYFNPHLPRGRWLFLRFHLQNFFLISIHTFLAEGDAHNSGLAATEQFQSTPSSRKVTGAYGNGLHNDTISIHTFLAEGDDGFTGAGEVVESISIHTFLAEGDATRHSVDINR